MNGRCAGTAVVLTPTKQQLGISAKRTLAISAILCAGLSAINLRRDSAMEENSRRANLKSDHRVGRFGWKAQHLSLAAFSQEACQTEMGVLNGSYKYRRELLSEACYAIYDAQYEDPYAASSYDGSAPSTFLFTDFTRFPDAPKSAQDYPGTTAKSISHGRRLFNEIGCGLCHTPSLRTGGDSDLIWGANWPTALCRVRQRPTGSGLRR